MNFKELKPGTSVEGDEIPAFICKNNTKTYTYIMAGVHGDEVEGVYVLKQLFEWLQQEEAIKTSLIVIPILNVDGYRAATRVNAHGVDLNRNCPSAQWSDKYTDAKYNPGSAPLSEPENVF